MLVNNFTLAILTLFLAACDIFSGIVCPGDYPNHLQGITVDDIGNIYWSFTTALVKTDKDGVMLSTVSVPSHYGDLTWVNNRIYAAVNHGLFNQETGKADSWVYIHEDADLAMLERHALPEMVYGAGGMEWHDGRFFVVGGLPATHTMNYVYEYSSEFAFVKRYQINSGYTTLGIQSVCRDQTGVWWFGCYGSPAVTLATDDAFRLLGKHTLHSAYGLARTQKSGSMLIGKNQMKNGCNEGSAYSRVMPINYRPPEDGVGADSAATPVYTSQKHNRAWMTVRANKVPLRVIWPAPATRALLEIVGMNSSFATNINRVVTSFLWLAVADRVCMKDDVYELGLTFYEEDRPIATNTAHLAVLSSVFRGAIVNPGKSGGAWSRVTGNVVIPYESQWLEDSADLMPPELTITKVGQSGQSSALTEMSGYFGWKLRDGNGYGQFDLQLNYGGVEQSLNATVNRFSVGLLLLVH